MIGGFFAVLGGATYVAGRLFGGMFRKSIADAYNQQTFNMARQDKLMHFILGGDSFDLKYVENLCGFRVDTSLGALGAEEAIRAIAQKEGWTFHDGTEQLHNKAFCRANGYKYAGNDASTRFWSDRNAWLSRMNWRFEHPHGRDVRISPFRNIYRNKEDYFAAVDRQCKLMGITK